MYARTLVCLYILSLAPIRQVSHPPDAHVYSRTCTSMNVSSYVCVRVHVFCLCKILVQGIHTRTRISTRYMTFIWCVLAHMCTCDELSTMYLFSAPSMIMYDKLHTSYIRASIYESNRVRARETLSAIPKVTMRSLSFTCDVITSFSYSLHITCTKR